MLLEVDPGEGVECAERLVEKQHRWSGHQGPRDGSALCHASRELPGQSRRELGETDPVDGLSDLVSGARRVGEAKSDVARHVEPGHETWLLEDDANRSIRPPDLVTGDPHRPRGREVEPGDETDQCALPTSAGPDHGDDLTGPDCQVDTGDRDMTRCVSLADPGQFDHRRTPVGANPSCQWVSLRPVDARAQSVSFPRSANRAIEEMITAGRPVC